MLGFSVSTDRCYGCKSCSVACANERLLRPGMFIRRVRQVSLQGVLAHAFVSMSCNHCDDPACLKNCPVRAYYKREDGLVLQDHDKCIGCQSCVAACPFHAPCYDPADSTTYKCDGCVLRLDAGLAPACQVACPSGNIAFGDFDVLSTRRNGAVSIKGLLDVAPNYALVPDSDIADMLPDLFADLDGFRYVTDTGSERSATKITWHY